MKYMRTNSFLKDFLICKDFAYLESTIEYEKEVKGWMHENGGKQSGVLCAAQNMIQLLTWQKKFDVSIRMIYYDVQALSLSYPIEAVRGRHCGGIKIPEWYNPNANVYSPAQLALLIKVKASLTGDDRVIMTSIIDRFTE